MLKNYEKLFFMGKVSYNKLYYGVKYMRESVARQVFAQMMEDGLH